MDMDPGPQRPLVSHGLRLAPGPADGLAGLSLLVGGLGAEVEAGALLPHAGPPPAVEDHQDEDDERHH